MPSATKTKRLGLNQWLGNEYPKRDDYNSDNLKIDEKTSSRIRELKAKTASYTVVADDIDTTITGTGNISITLPAISTAGIGTGFRCRISNVGTGTITVAASGTDTIAGSASVSLSAKKSIEVVADAAGIWTVLAFDFTDLISTVLPESGTFTPKIEGSSVAGAHTYSVQEGRYYKIGKLCFIDLTVTLTAKDGTMAGDAIITGLPFASAASGNKRTGISIGRIANVSLPSASYTQFAAMIQPVTARIFIVPTGGNQAATTLQSAQINATSDIRLSGVYEIV